MEEQGWCSGESTRLPPMWPRFQRYMWVECVVDSRPCSERFFFGFSSFPYKFQFDPESEGHRFVSHNIMLGVTPLNKDNLLFIFILQQAGINTALFLNGTLEIQKV